MTAHGYDAYPDGDEVEVHTPEVRPVGYQSPVMARLQGQGKLTLDLLRADVPLLHAGEAAQARLDGEEPLTKKQRERLLAQVEDGKAAKERLVLAGIPLIKHLAHKEHVRRQNWQSQVSYEDLLQEGVAGFIRGLRAYKPEGAQKSPTNYLGQWIMVEMRRKVEEFDHDFAVAYDTAEMIRKIRAIRSRLVGELGRFPTDEEILEAANDPRWRGGAKMGRVVKKSDTVSPRRQLQQKHLDTEREVRDRTGQMVRFVNADKNEDVYTGPTIEAALPLTEPVGPGESSEEVLAAGVRDGMSRLLRETFDLMGLPPVQRDVISRRFGLPPHEAEQSARDISRDLNLHRERVGRVIEAFTEEMVRPGGPFHRACERWDPEDLIDLGLGWALKTLGDWAGVEETAKKAPVPEVLTVPLTPRRGTVPPPAEQPAGARGPQIRAQFMCDYHGWGFVGVYATRAEVPKARACPQCGRDSALVRVMTG